MTDFAWPSTVVPSTSALTWVDNTVVFRSPLSGTIRTETRPGGRWSMSVTVANLKQIGGLNSDVKLIEAFLFRLNGAAHRAVLKDFAYKRAGAGGSSSPLVNGMNQTGLTLITNGWGVDFTTVLQAGDRIGVSGQMIPITEDAITDGAASVTLQLAHPIRQPPADNSIIEIDNPTATYILTNKASFSSAPGIFKTVLAEFEEVIS